MKPRRTRAAPVWLVGAGPGDPNLLTLAAAQVLRAADLVFYDALVSEKIIRDIPLAKRISVGKRGGELSPTQDRINRRLVSAAKRGLRIVRLKGGDPFLFGRGGEEADYLRKRGLRVCVVPGISSAPAAASSAGFPLTDRRVASSVTFLTAASADAGGHPRRIDYKHLVRLGGTWVFFMGLRALPRIVERLLKSGASSALPAAVISMATTTRQRVITSALSRICEKTEKFGIEAPALTIVGSVVNLRPPPLLDKPVLVLRPEHQIGKLSDMLRRKGAVVTECPAIEIVPVCPNPRLERVQSCLEQYDWILLTSANSVRLLKTMLTGPALKANGARGSRIAAIGPGTVEALREIHVRADLIPKRDFSSDGLAAAFLSRNKKRQNIFLPQADMARDTLLHALTAAGHQVFAVPLYTTRPLSKSFAKIRHWIQKSETGLVPLTSASIARSFAAASRHMPKKHLRLVSIGPITTVAAIRAGLEISAQSPQASLSDMTETLETVA